MILRLYCDSLKKSFSKVDPFRRLVSITAQCIAIMEQYNKINVKKGSLVENLVSEIKSMLLKVIILKQYFIYSSYF